MTSEKESPHKAPGKAGSAPTQQGTASTERGGLSGGGRATAEGSQGEAQPDHSIRRHIGRPKVRFEALKTVPTRCPAQIYTYLKGITPFLYGSLTEMFADMIKRFIDERPWERGLRWRKPKTATTFAKGELGRTGWEQVQMQLPVNLAQDVARLSKANDVSNAAFCYTAIFWWVQYIYPPEKMMPKK